MAKMNVKKGDQVQIISGKDRGKQGEVLRAFPLTARSSSRASLSSRRLSVLTLRARTAAS